MTEVLDILLDSLRNAVLISGLVVVMMMLIESMNITSRGDFFSGLRRSRIGQVAVSAALGAVPGCMGGFASVSLYTHGIISFGALVAMMIASSGDEAFVMLAMMPDKAWWIFLVLLAIAIVAGLVVDLIYKPSPAVTACCEPSYAIHSDEDKHTGRHFTLRRVLMLLGVVAFVVALLSGVLEHEHAPALPSASAAPAQPSTSVAPALPSASAAPASGMVSDSGSFNLLSEEWMYWLFGGLSLILLAVLIFGDDHFVEEHLWHHIVVRHLPSVFCWTFGVLLVLGFGLRYLDIASWINSNTVLMILLATLVGIIPESGPHLVFVTLYAAGVVPFPVLLASCISQDGHASLPLLAESKSGFLRAKALNCLVALLAAFAAYFLIG